jgi:hypothetical protein
MQAFGGSVLSVRVSGARADDLVLKAMNKQELAERLAKQSHTSRAEAADAVDKLIYQILKDLPRPSEDGAKDRNNGVPKLPSITPIRRK